MSWILATDVRSGERYAFPQIGCAVSFDLTSVRRDVDVTRKHNAEQETMFAAIASARPATEEQRAMFEAQVAESKKVLRRMETAEGIVLFDGERYVVRSLKHTTSWDEVEAYTKRTLDATTTEVE